MQNASDKVWFKLTISCLNSQNNKRSQTGQADFKNIERGTKKKTLEGSLSDFFFFLSKIVLNVNRDIKENY